MRFSTFISFSFFLISLTGESLSLTMLGLTRGMRGNSGEPLYFPEENDLPSKKSNNVDPDLDKTFVRVIGTVAGREIIPRRWDENEPVRYPFLDAEGVPLRQSPVISRVLSRHGGLY